MAFKEIAKVFATKIRRRFDETSQILYKAEKKTNTTKQKLKKKLLIYFFIFSLRFFTFPLSFLIFHFFSFFAFLIHSNPRHTHFFFIFGSLLRLVAEKNKRKIKNKKDESRRILMRVNFLLFSY